MAKKPIEHESDGNSVQPLRFNQIYIALDIYLIGAVLALIAFVIEMIAYQMKLRKRRYLRQFCSRRQTRAMPMKQFRNGVWKRLKK